MENKPIYNFMNTSELKYEGKKFTMRWNPKEEIILIKTWGVHDLEDAKEYSKTFTEFAEEIPDNEPLQILTDVSEQSKLNRNTTLKARKEYSRISKHPRSGDSAVVGANIIIRVVVAFISAFSKRKNIKCFADKEKALKWLKEKRAKK